MLHGDETTWRVQALREKGRSSRAWLWTSLSADAVSFHIDPSRSAEAAQKLFAAAVPHTVLVFDRYRAYKRLARLLGSVVMRLTPAGGRDRGLAADTDLERHGYTRYGNQPITIR